MPNPAVPLSSQDDLRTIEESRPTLEVARREAVYRRMLALADIGSAAIALLLTLSILGQDNLRPAALLALPLVVIVAKLQGLYERDALLLKKTTLDEAPQLFGLATLYTLLLMIGQSVLVQGRISAHEAVGLWLLLFVCAVAGRSAARLIARRVSGIERVLVIGPPDAALRLDTKFSEQSIAAELVGRMPFAPDGDPTVLGRSLDDLEEVVLTYHIHRVIVVPQGTASEDMIEAVRAAKGLGVRVSVLPRILEAIGTSVEFDHLNGVTVMGVRRFGLNRSSAVVKRALDLAGALLGLLFLMPLLGLFAVLVRLGSPGPVLFRQRRIGRDGKPFEIFKFRTMLDGADALKSQLHGRNEADGLFKIADDPRVTSIGRFLRHTSMDELPQLLNVLRGEMSLVGPRPLVEDEDERIEGLHRRRLHLKPGMTGQWQIFGSSRIPLDEMVTIDYLYVANWSLWGDVKILCRTVPYVLSRRGL